ncbi:hypothetical protein B1J94_03460 [Leptospira kirschneri serovar Grippotyphosa]|nr:hypothetical protein B1J94_03460 [Leptospira kirschneri serovar Grippotyphosa]
MNSPSVSISWKRAIEIVLLNATMEFFNNFILSILCRVYRLKILYFFVVCSFLSFFGIKPCYVFIPNVIV